MHARCEVQKCVSYVDPERYPERNLNDTPCVAWKARAHPTFQPAFPANGWLHISGITANSTSKPAVISHAHARFCKRPLKKHISGIAANTKSKPAISHVTLDFASSRSRNTSVASQQTPNQNQPFPMLRSILQAAAQETHQWHRSKHQIKTSRSPCRRLSRHSRNHLRPQWHRSKEQIKTSHSSLQACPRIPIDAV